jgi:hypothetical protein
VIDFERLLEVAIVTRSFIQTSENQAQALRDLVTANDVVFGIFPADKDGLGLHVIKGSDVLRDIAGQITSNRYNHTVIPFQNREQAARLEALVT